MVGASSGAHSSASHFREYRSGARIARGEPTPICRNRRMPREECPAAPPLPRAAGPVPDPAGRCCAAPGRMPGAVRPGPRRTVRGAPTHRGRPRGPADPGAPPVPVNRTDRTALPAPRRREASRWPVHAGGNRRRCELGPGRTSCRRRADGRLPLYSGGSADFHSLFAPALTRRFPPWRCRAAWPNRPPAEHRSRHRNGCRSASR